MTGFRAALKRAVATFVFATTGVLIGANLFDADVATWKLAASTGLGALINLAYRWSESTLKERDEPADDGSADVVTVLVVVALILAILYMWPRVT